MDEQQHIQRRAQEAIEQGRALVRDARHLLARSRQQFAELGIDPQAEYERLQAQGGDEAVARAGSQYQALLDDIEAEVRRNAMHAQVRGGGGRHARLRPNKV